MSDLDRFVAWLGERRAVVAAVEQRLGALQEKYETFFQEIERTREAELQQLRDLLAGLDAGIPADLAAELDSARAVAEADLDRETAALEERHTALRAEAEEIRQASRRSERYYRKKHEALDAEEEALKERNEDLLARIAEHNRRIRSLSRGFGFFLNLFRMRRLRAERRALDEEQADVAARIDDLRRRWVTSDATRAEKEGEREAAWVRQKTEADAVQAKLDHVRATRVRIVERTALEAVLFARRPSLREPSDGDPPCPRCGRPNPDDHHFCHVCALRLGADRTDLAGSLREVAELNVHHGRFADGVKACQELIGLLRGLLSGVDAFAKSVRDVKATEDRYPLPKLQIAVPSEAVAWSAVFEELQARIARKDGSLHPRLFAADIRAFADERLTEDAIRTWFEAMGERLSECADAQW